MMEKYRPTSSHNFAHIKAKEDHRHSFLVKRPKSSPSLRSGSSGDHDQATMPSYQARRLERHGSSKFSRSTTSLLWQHSISKDHLSTHAGTSWSKAVQKVDPKQGNSWSNTLQNMQRNGSHKPEDNDTGAASWIRAKKKLDTVNKFSSGSSPRLEAWANDKPALTKSASVLTSTSSSSNLLRPQTANLIRRRLRHVVRTRIKSAVLRSNYDDFSGSEISDGDNEEIPVSARSPSPSPSPVTKKNITKHVLSSTNKEITENGPNQTLETKGIPNKPNLPNGASNEPESSGPTIKTKEVAKSPVKKTKIGWADEQPTPVKTNDGSNPIEVTVSEPPTPASLKSNIVKAFQSSGRKSPSIHESDKAEDTPSESSEKQYTDNVPEFKLGTGDFSIPLSVTEENRKLSVAVNLIKKADPQRKPSGAADMMRRNRHSRHKRLSVYLQTAAARKTESPIDKLKRILKTIRIIAGICIALKSYVKEGKTKQWSLVEMQLNLKADMEKTLAFDPLMFTNLHVTRGSHKLKVILSKLPKYRTKRDIDVVVALLRKNRTFANYHRDTQTKLAKVMEYQRFEARRIVLKEGHAPSCYYIILSGICLVNQLDFDRRNNSQFVTTVKEIGPGECFGEVALLTDSLRESSIICKEEVELLLINKDDFMSIIRIPLENEQKELIKYCVLQDVLTDQMFENVKITYKTIKSQYYKPGTVISKDLNKDEYIYVIKGGNCRILSEVIEYRKKKSNKQTMSDESWKKKAALKRSMSLLGGAKQRRAGWAAFARKQLENGSSSGGISNKPFVRHTDSSLNSFSAIPASEYLQAHVALQKDSKVADKTAVARTWRRVTAAANSVTERARIKNEEEHKNIDLIERGVKTTFALVADLSSGSVCGLETLLTTLKPDTRLCLVSDGVDCILVSKKVFNNSKNTAKTVQIVNNMATEYPSCSDQLNSIVRARTWAAYKDKVVGDVAYRKEASRGKVL